MAAQTFIGRAAELHQLEANYRAAREGELRLVLLAGEAGIGKTRLLTEFLKRITDASILTGACLSLESAPLPFAPIVDALHGLVHSTPASELTTVLGPARGELARLLPEIADGPVPPQSAGSKREARSRLFEHLLGVLERAASRQPMILAIEDIHWADPETRDLLRFLVRGLRRSPVLMVATQRTDDTGSDPAGAAFAAELSRLGSAARVDVPPFDELEVGALAAELLGRPTSLALRRRLADRSDGVPFVVEQLVVAGGIEGNVPPTLADTIRSRVGSLSDTGRAVLGVAAACGRRVDESLVVEVSGMTPDRVDEGLAEAVRAGLLVAVEAEGQMRYEFRHALLREAVDLGMLLSDRKRLHLAAATALSQRAGSGQNVASELAHHWEAAEEWDRALTAHLEAATAAERLYAWAAAVTHCERAVAIAQRQPSTLEVAGVDRVELLHRAADAAYRAGDYDAAIARAREAIRLVGDDPPRLGALHERLRWYLWDAGDRRGAMEALQEALRLIPPRPASVALASVLGQLAAVEMHGGRLDEALVTARRALRMARQTNSLLDVGQARGVLGWIQVVNGDVNAGLATLDEALSTAVAAGDFGGTALGSALIAQMNWWIGREAAAREAALDGYDRVASLGLLHAYGGMLLGHVARADIALGAWKDADDVIAQALEHELVSRPPERGQGGGRRAGPSARSAKPGPVPWPRINRARLLIARGAWAEATEDLLEARAFESAHGPTEYGVDLLAAETELAAWRGDVLTARVAVGQLAELPPSAPFGPAHARVAAAAVWAEADEAERSRAGGDGVGELDARQRAEQIAAIVHAAVPDGSHLLASAAWSALVAWVDAETARAQDTADAPVWEALARAWDQAGHPLDAAYARYRLGSALLQDPLRLSDGRAMLESARSAAAQLGAGALEERIDEAGNELRQGVAGAVPGITADVIAHEVSRITVHALGRMRVERDGVPIRNLGGPKAGRRQAEAILAFLLDRGPRGVTKDEVIEMIWDELDLESADLAFHRTLGGLRRTLRPEPASRDANPIAFDHDRYTLDPGVVTWTDVMAFTAAVDEAQSSPDPFTKAMALEEARRLYRGEYFDDCPYYGDSAEVEPTRTRLRARYGDVLVMLGELAEERGDIRSAERLYDEALSVSEDLVAAADGLSRLGRLGRQLRVVSA